MTTAGTDADVAYRLILKFKEMHNTDSNVMIVENCFYFAFKSVPESAACGAAYHRVNELDFEFFNELNVFSIF